MLKTSLKVLGSTLYLAAWVIVWMLLLNGLTHHWHSWWVTLTANGLYGFWTWGCLWAINHDSFHKLKVKYLPQVNRDGLVQHFKHHHEPNQREHLFVPMRIWQKLLKLTFGLSVGFTLLQLPGTTHWYWLCANYIACWLGMLSFMELYRLVHDRAHTQPDAELRWWFPRSHVVYHHRHVRERPGLYPVYEVLVRPGIVFYAAILRTVKHFNDADHPKEL